MYSVTVKTDTGGCFVIKNVVEERVLEGSGTVWYKVENTDGGFFKYYEVEPETFLFLGETVSQTDLFSAEYFK